MSSNTDSMNSQYKAKFLPYLTTAASIWISNDTTRSVYWLKGTILIIKAISIYTDMYQFIHTSAYIQEDEIELQNSTNDEKMQNKIEVIKTNNKKVLWAPILATTVIGNIAIVSAFAKVGSLPKQYGFLSVPLFFVFLASVDVSISVMRHYYGDNKGLKSDSILNSIVSLLLETALPWTSVCTVPNSYLITKLTDLVLDENIRLFFNSKLRERCDEVRELYKDGFGSK